MVDREKVIKKLESLRDICNAKSDMAIGNGKVAWAGYANAVNDALAMLKEQKHSETFIVIDNKTGKEADTYNIALHEDWAKHLCYCDMEGWAIEEDGTLLLVDECGRFAYADRERFKVKWE